jgi:hypothetical protein
LMKSTLRATKNRPDAAALVYSLNLVKDRRAFWLLQITALAFFFIFGFLFLSWTILLRPGLLDTLSTGVEITLKGLLVLILGVLISILLHEMIHGVFFWIFSGSRPKFGLRGGYAYAAAPGWFFPRAQYLVIVLAPFLLLSILGMVLVVAVPVGALAAILFGMLANAAGSAGDFWIAGKVLRERRNIVVEDLGDGVNIYALS